MLFTKSQHERAWLSPRGIAPAGLVRAVLCASLVTVWGLASQAWAAKALWEFTPYRVQVVVAADRDPALPISFAQELAEQLLQRAEAVIGSPWDVESQPAPAALAYVMRWRFEQMQFEDVPRAAPEFDKVLLVRVTRNVSGHEVAARDFDVRTRQFGTVMRRDVPQPALLNEIAFETVLAAFAPLAQVEVAEKKKAEIRLRAAALPTRDPSITVLTQAQVYRAVIRTNGADGGVKAITVMPWTYLAVQTAEEQSADAKSGDMKSPDLKSKGAKANDAKAAVAASPSSPIGGTVACRIHSGLRNPLSNRRRGRVEQLAVAVHPPRLPTRLEVASITDPTYALAGYEVHAHRPDSPTTKLLGYTDGRGSLLILPDDAHPLRLLILKNGGEPLARLPVVPGVEPTAKALIPNDEQRLRVEGFISGLQERMVDVVARRQVFMVLIRVRLQAGKLAEAEEMYKRLRALPDLEQFRQELADFERGIVTNDVRLRKRIDQFFTDTRKVLDTNMSPKPIEEIAAQIEGAKSKVATR